MREIYIYMCTYMNVSVYCIYIYYIILYIYIYYILHITYCTIYHMLHTIYYIRREGACLETLSFQVPLEVDMII